MDDRSRGSPGGIAVDWSRLELRHCYQLPQHHRQRRREPRRRPPEPWLALRSPRLAARPSGSRRRRRRPSAVRSRFDPTHRTAPYRFGFKETLTGGPHLVRRPTRTGCAAGPDFSVLNCFGPSSFPAVPFIQISFNRFQIKFNTGPNFEIK